MEVYESRGVKGPGILKEQLRRDTGLSKGIPGSLLTRAGPNSKKEWHLARRWVDAATELVNILTPVHANWEIAPNGKILIRV